VDNSAAALEMIFSKQPDLILMDIEINGNMSGIDIGRAIAHLNIPILYITAMQGAAYEQAAQLPGTIGYLVKPVDKITLRSAINLSLAKAHSVRKETAAISGEELYQDSFTCRDYLFFKKKEVFYKVPFQEMACIQSNDNYCDIFTTTGKIYTLRITLSKLEDMLPGGLFVRTHRQHIVQTRLIREVNLNDSTLVAHDKVIPVSRENKSKIENLVKLP